MRAKISTAARPKAFPPRALKIAVRKTGCSQNYFITRLVSDTGYGYILTIDLDC